MANETEKIPKWLMGIIVALAIAAITGTGGTLFALNAQVAKLEGTQDQLVKQLDLLFEELIND